MMRPPEGFIGYKWQVEASKRIGGDPLARGLACAAKPGAGKTAAAGMAWIESNAKRVLVIAPAGDVARTWCTFAATWGATGVALCGGPGEGQRKLRDAIVDALTPVPRVPSVLVAVVPWSRLSREDDSKAVIAALAHLYDVGLAVDFLTVDEAHYAQNAEKTSRGKALLGGMVRGERARGVRAYCRKVLALTGTPSTSDPKKIYACLLLAGLDRNTSPFAPNLRTSFKYEEVYWEGEMIWDHAARMKTWQCADDPTPAHAELMRAGVLRVNPAELAQQLPAHRREMWADLDAGPNPTPDVAHALAEWAKAVELGQPAKVPPMTECATIRRGGTKARAEAIAEWVESWHDEEEGNRMLIIWCEYIESVDTLWSAVQEKIGGDNTLVLKYSGAMTAGQRSQTLDIARRGDCRVLIATGPSMRTGVDGLQHVCDTQIMAELPWTPGEIEQQEGRIVRTGQTNPVRTIWVSAGVEGTMAHVLGKKAIRLEAVLASGEDSTPPPAPDSLMFEGVTLDLEPMSDPLIVPAGIMDVPEDLTVPWTQADPCTARWTWARDRSNPGGWVARADSAGDEAWTGEAATLRTLGGQLQEVTLGKRRAFGEGWSLWEFTKK